MAKAAYGSIVKVNYSVKLEDGSIFDSNMEQEPLTFGIGLGEVIPGLDEAVIGMEPGESKTMKIPMEKAYGEHKAEMVKTVERKELAEDWNPAVGEHYQIRNETGGVSLITVKEVSDKELTLDYNHPLAGKELTVEVTLLEIL